MIPSPTPTLRTEDLPAWMRPVPRATNWGPVLAALIGLMAAWAFLLQPGVPGNTGLFHSAYMTADLADSMRDGLWAPRWNPDVQGGYGAPIAHYIPQGAAYSAALIEVFFTGDTAGAVRLAAIFASVGTAVAVYIWVARASFAGAGLLAATLAVFSPYLGLYGPHVVGDLSGMLSAALLPAMLWSMYRLSQSAGPFDALLAASFTGALILNDPRVAAAGLCVSLIQISWRLRDGVRMLLATVLGGMLASPFWLPALLEYNAVNWQAPIAQFAERFQIHSMFASVSLLDPAAYNSAPRWTLGPWLAILMVLSIAWWLRTGAARPGSFVLRMLLAVTGIALFAQLTGTDPRWIMPILSVCAAALAAQSLRWFGSSARLRIVTAGGVGLTIALSLPVWLSPLSYDGSAFTRDTAMDFEMRGLGPAPLQAWQALPSALRSGVSVNTTINRSTQNNQPNRVFPGSAARFSPLTYSPFSSSWQVSTSGRAPVTFAVPDFPGWRVELNGEAVTTTPRASDGLLEVVLPPVTGGLLTLTLGPTPARNTAWALVWAGGLSLMLWTRRRARTMHLTAPPVAPLDPATLRLSVVTIALGAGLLFLVAPQDAPLDGRIRGFTSLIGAETVQAVAEPGAVLLAYRLETFRARAGETVEIQLHWQAQRPISENAQTRLVLVSVDTGDTVLELPYHSPGGIPMRRWNTNTFITDRNEVHIPAALSPGGYQFGVEVVSCRDLACSQPQPIRFRSGRSEVVISRVLLPATLTLTNP